MEFETGEEVIWKGRPASQIRYLILTVLFFGIFVINLGPIGQAIGVISFFLMIIFLATSIVSVFLDKGKKYYLTNRRVISHKASLLVSDLSNVRMETVGTWAAAWGRKRLLRFEDGRWIAFKHVKDPAQIVQSGLKLSGAQLSSIGPVSSLICNYCGARVPASALKCPTCGADM